MDDTRAQHHTWAFTTLIGRPWDSPHRIWALSGATASPLAAHPYGSSILAMANDAYLTANAATDPHLIPRPLTAVAVLMETRGGTHMTLPTPDEHPEREYQTLYLFQPDREPVDVLYRTRLGADDPEHHRIHQAHDLTFDHATRADVANNTFPIAWAAIARQLHTIAYAQPKFITAYHGDLKDDT